MSDNRQLQCATCERWFAGLKETDTIVPYHRNRREPNGGCVGSGQRPKATRGYTNPPRTT